MRTGKFETLSPLMPWIAFRNLDDADLAAIHAALQTAHPVAHAVSNVGEATLCPVCLQQHGAGNRNRLELPKGIALAPAALAQFAGRYHLAAYDETITIVLEAGSLWLVEGSERHRMIPVAPMTFEVPGTLAPIVFEREGGRIARFREKAPGGVAFERQDD